MKKSVLYLLFIATLASCQPTDDDSVIIQGQVREDNSGTGLSGAAVVITDPPELSNRFTSTDSSGQYVFDDLDITEATDVTLRATENGYNPSTRTITALPEQTYNLNFELTSEDEENPGNDDGNDGVVTGEPGVPAAIVLTNVSEESINIRQTGGTVSTTFSFSVQDSAGRPMDENSITEVNFRILNGPGGGEAIVPLSVNTNDRGNVVTSMFSGDSAGVVRMEAYINRNDGARISSSPILVAIHGGFPSQENFFVAPANRNLEGYGFVYPGAPSGIYSITASVGDQFGNPVKVGTSVDFRTPKAGIINGSAVTDDNGFASVSFYPNGSTPDSHPDGVGFFDVRAHTYDGDNSDITRDVTLLFTTRDAIITFDAASFDVPANGSANIGFTVTDGNGYPMAAGTEITVTSVERIGISGDGDVTLGDYFSGGPGRTQFTVSLTDLDDEDSTPVDASLTVTVVTPSGYETSRTITGQRAKFR
jgi:hypothetical protein